MIEKPATLKMVGNYRELKGGRARFPSASECRDVVERSVRARAGAYLRAGGVISTSGMLVDDCFGPRKGIAELATLSDGEWLWPAALGYYVEVYGLAIPPAFLQHMAAHSWTCPKTTREQRIAVGKALRTGEFEEIIL